VSVFIEPLEGRATERRALLAWARSTSIRAKSQTT
jgi:hypothetical protein